MRTPNLKIAAVLTGLVSIATVLAPPAAAQQPAQQLSERCAQLNVVLSRPSSELVKSTTQLQMAANYAREDCVPTISAHLRDTSQSRVGAAAYALFALGGSQATEALRARGFSTAVPEPAVRFLVAAMEGAQLGGGVWVAKHDAALMLGVLRAQDAADPLRAAAAAGRGQTAISQAASAALGWMDRPACSLADRGDPTAAQASMVMLVALCGVPTFTSATASFTELDNAFAPVRVWSLVGGRWESRAFSAADSLLRPTMRVEVRPSADGGSAIVNILTSFGPGNGNGYRYYLRRDAGNWRVTGIAFSGVA